MQKKSEKLESKASRVFNSAVGFAAAYLIINAGYQVITGIIANWFKVGRSFTLFEVDVTQKTELWSLDKIILIYSSGFLLCILISIIGYLLYKKYRSKELVLNMFFLWLHVIGFCVAISHFLSGVLANYDHNSAYYYGLSVIYAWMYLPKIVTFPLLFIATLLLVFFSYFTAKKFLSFTYSYSKINKSSRRQSYFVSVALLPALMGGAVAITCIALSYIFSHNHNIMPENYGFIHISIVQIGVTLFALFVGMLFSTKAETDPESLIRYKNLQHISMPIFLLFLAVLSLYIFFADGFSL